MDDVDAESVRAEPLRVPDSSDAGEPMPEEAREAQVAFDRQAEDAHQRLAEESDVVRLVTIHLPMDATPAGRIMEFVGEVFPKAMTHYNSDGDLEVFHRVPTGEGL